MPGGGELFIIVLVIIMFFGAKKIPELARALGKGMQELKNATNDIQREIKGNANPISEIKDAVDIKKQMKDLMKDEPISNSSEEKTVQKENKEEKESVENTVKRGGNLFESSDQLKKDNT
ncbi:MAG: twin-arginine translocase TatA/TatE family subunit [Vicingus serpentipes]|nr:twin-arginine translocase TatA/TatE family subunit [Vicingus serpentipes]